MCILHEASPMPCSISKVPAPAGTQPVVIRWKLTTLCRHWLLWLLMRSPHGGMLIPQPKACSVRHLLRLQGRRSSDEHAAVCQELVLGDLQIEGRGALAGAPGGIVVAAMAGTEPAMVVARIGQGHAPCRAVTSLSSPFRMSALLHTALLSIIVLSSL